MKINLKLVFGTIVFLVWSAGVFAQNKPLDCTKSLDPRTPYYQTQIGCSIASTPNNLAARAIDSYRWVAPPTVKQCQADLASWDQATADWLKQNEAAANAHNQAAFDAIRRPEELLSVEELYRRSNEANRCSMLLKDQFEQRRMEENHISLLKEQLSRAEAVIDKNLLWLDFRNQ